MSVYNVFSIADNTAMPRDYASKAPKKRKPAARKKPRSNARKPTTKHSSRWPWMLASFVAGIVLTILIQRWENPQQDIVQAIEEIAGDEAAPQAKPRFDFYTLLPESEVVIPAVEPSPARNLSQEANKSQETSDNKKPESKPLFMLQAGSFRNTGDADNLRIRLLLLNMDVHIEAATSQSAGTWHRVIVGPFNSHSTLASARASLRQNGIDNIVLKR